MAKLDKKFYGELRKVKDDSVVPEDEWVVFLARDKHLPEILSYYQELCLEDSDARQAEAAGTLLDNVYKWQRENPGKVHPPGIAEGEKLLP